MSVFALTLIATLLTLIVKCYWSISTIKIVALFLGLEGTVLLGAALSPPYDEIKVEQPKTFLKKLSWPFTEGKGLAFPIRYNYVYFYVGLLLLATSLVLSAIAQ